jgi:hypothetical protein
VKGFYGRQEGPYLLLFLKIHLNLNVGPVPAFLFFLSFFFLSKLIHTNVKKEGGGALLRMLCEKDGLLKD